MNHRWMRHLNALVPAGALVALMGCGHQVTRISDGSTRLERPISPEAYSAFARARLAERTGDRATAEAGYREVIRIDGDADEAYVRLGVLACRDDVRAATKAFEHAEQANPKSAALYVAKAECALSQHQSRLALASAAAALQRAPTDPRVSQLLIRALLANGKRDEALRYAWAHVAMFPHDRSGWIVLADGVGQGTSQSAQLRARAADGIPSEFADRLLTMSSSRAAGPERIDAATKSNLDLQQALMTNDGPKIQHAARALRLGVVQLAARAHALGAYDFAKEQAAIAGAIQPDDPAIWLERLWLADILNNEVEFQKLLARPPQVPQTTSTDSHEFDWSKLYEIIKRRTGVRWGG